MGCLACAALMLDRGGITLYRKESSSIPIEADSICPDRFLGKGPADIGRLPAYYGRRRVTLGDLFDIDGAGADDITVSGDLKHVKKIGLGMSMGTITVKGDVGPHLGAYMSGGEIVVQGGAGDWVGAHMSGGRIVVDGDAGHFVGAAYSGEARGVTGGAIIIGGTAGNEAGSRMRRGTVVIFGNAGEFTGASMIAGTILVFGAMGARAGAGMKRGTIAALGPDPEILPTFRYACLFQPAFLRFYLRRLREWGLVVDPGLDEARYRRYVGDVNQSGRGEVLVRDQPQ